MRRRVRGGFTSSVVRDASSDMPLRHRRIRREHIPAVSHARHRTRLISSSHALTRYPSVTKYTWSASGTTSFLYSTSAQYARIRNSAHPVPHARVHDVIASAKHHGALRRGHEVRRLGRVHGYRLRHVARAARRQRHAVVVERDDHRDVLMVGTLSTVEIRVPVLALRLALALRGVAIDDARAASVAALLEPAREPPLARRPRASARRRSTGGTDARSRAMPRARSRRASSDSSSTPRPSLRARRSRVGVDDFSTDRLHLRVRETPLERGVARFGRIEHGRAV